MTYAFLIALIAGAVGCAILAVMWKTAQIATIATVGERDALKKALAERSAADEISGLNNADEKAKLEAVIVSLKGELTRLEADVATCRSPDAVRARLRGLLGR